MAGKQKVKIGKKKEKQVTERKKLSSQERIKELQEEISKTKYNKRSKGRRSRGQFPNRVDISERPQIVEAKVRLGDWEVDTIVGHEQSGAVVSMVDRASKLTRRERERIVSVLYDTDIFKLFWSTTERRANY